MLLHTLTHGETAIARAPLSELPYALGPWTGQEQPLLQPIVAALNVTDYANRVYVDTARVPIQLYVGYYSSQRTGDTIHSPKNCLPGSGWEPVQSGRVTIEVRGDRRIVVNEYLIQKDQNKQMVYYWYQSRGRVIASEYDAKFWMITDAISHNRTDGALVRVVTPVIDGEPNARVRLTQFTQALFPQLDGILPN